MLRILKKAMPLSLSAFMTLGTLQVPLSSQSQTDPFSNWQITKTAGMQFFNPEQVLNGTIGFKELPELSYITTERNDEIGEQIRRLTDFLMNNGVTLGLGVNSNRDTFFNLYGPAVDILLDEPAAQFGSTRESEVGKLHFITHDSSHLYFGVPGPRLSDLKDKAKAKEKLKKILMNIEAAASAWTSVNHVRWYWRYRHMKQTPGADMKNFDRLNKGLSSVGNFNNQDYIDLIKAYMNGEVRNMVKLYSRNLNYDLYKDAKEAQVPMLFPNFEKKLGSFGEKLLFKYGFQVIFPLVHMYDKKFGYVSLINYAGMQADYYLSDWYVKWADAFQIGEELDVLEKNLNRKMDDLREGQYFPDVKPAKKGVFELMYMRNTVADFGRKFIEFLQLNDDLKAQGKSYLSAQDIADMNGLLEEAKTLNKRLLAIKAENRDVTAAEFQNARSKTLQMITEAQVRFPIDKYLPVQYRPAHADYSNFWRDSFAVVLPRPEGMTKFLSAKGIWTEALRQRLERARAEATGKKYIEVDMKMEPTVVGDLEKQLAKRFNDEGRKGKTVLESTGPINEIGDYLQKVELERRSINAQILKVFLPQVMLIPEMPSDMKQNLIHTSQRFAAVMDARLVQFKEDYKKRFMEYDRSEVIKERLLSGETDIKWAVETSMNSMIEIINLLEQSKDFKKIQKQINFYLKKIAKNTADIESGKEIIPSLAETIKKVTPVKTGLVRTLCSAISRMCVNQNLSKIIRDVHTRPFLREKDQKAEIVFIDKNNREVKNKFNLPDNAGIIIGMNHDNASLDGMYLQEIAEILGVDRNILFTTKDAWPHIIALEKVGITQKDQNILFKQDQDTKRKVIAAFQAQKKGRIAFSIFPEGELPFWHTQFPLFANFGAFNIARSASHALKGVKPVYYVEVMSNFLRVTTSKEKVQTRIEIHEPELVPTDAVGLRDAWVESRRERFEKRANSSDRRGKLVDMIERQKISQDGRIYVVDDVREYKAPGQFFQELVDSNTDNAPIVKSCKEMMSGL